MLHQHGLLRPLSAAELSDGTLRYPRGRTGAARRPSLALAETIAGSAAAGGAVQSGLDGDFAARVGMRGAAIWSAQ